VGKHKKHKVRKNIFAQKTFLFDASLRAGEAGAAIHLSSLVYKVRWIASLRSQ